MGNWSFKRGLDLKVRVEHGGAVAIGVNDLRQPGESRVFFGASVLAGYTFSKAMDDSSSATEQVMPFNPSWNGDSPHLTSNRTSSSATHTNCLSRGFRIGKIN